MSKQPQTTGFPLTAKQLNCECEVCGSFKHQHEEFCVDCTRHKKAANDARKNKLRNERFGGQWG